MIFYYVNLVLNGSYSVSAFSIAYWVFLLPIFIYYTFYALMGALQYIMLSSRILRIRQQHWLEEFEKQRKKMLGSWKLFMGANARLLHICKHITEYSRLNNPILNALMPFLELVQPFLMSIFFFDDSSADVDGAGNALLYMLTTECSTLDKVNDRIEGSLQKFNFAFSSSFVIVFALAATVLSVDGAVDINVEIKNAINTYLLPYLNKAENWVQGKYTPEVQEKLKNAVHQDLSLLQKVVSADNIQKTEAKLIEIINNPKELVTDASNIIDNVASALPKI
ncbi:hypothetical protein TYRP_003832 [Tyrophagus putrescentiae]|nr:hypothetical protein TYRP_003832 [Tyrophagus putrescentiae]